MERRERIKKYYRAKDLIKNYINDINNSSTILNKKNKDIIDSNNNNTRDAFTSFQEEKHNEFSDDKDLDNTIDKDNEKKADDFISQTIEIKKAIKNGTYDLEKAIESTAEKIVDYPQSLLWK